MTFDIAGSLYIPFDVVHYAEALCGFATDLSANYNDTLRGKNITLGMSFEENKAVLSSLSSITP